MLGEQQHYFRHKMESGLPDEQCVAIRTVARLALPVGSQREPKRQRCHFFGGALGSYVTAASNIESESFWL